MFTITNGFTYIAFLMFLAGGLLALEKYTKWKVFNVVPPLVWIYVLNMIFCTMGLYASDACSAVYSALKNNLLYAMIFVMLLRCDFRKLAKLGGRMIAIFLGCSLTLGLGFLVFYPILMGPLGGGEKTWAAVAALYASWVGGSANMAAMQDALPVDSGAYSCALALDTVCYSVWIALLLLAVRYANKWNKATKANTSGLDAIAAAANAEVEKDKARKATSGDWIFLIGLSLLVSAISQSVGAAMNAGLANMGLDMFDKGTCTTVFVTVLGLICAMTPLGKLPPWRRCPTSTCTLSSLCWLPPPPSPICCPPPCGSFTACWSWCCTWLSCSSCPRSSTGICAWSPLPPWLTSAAVHRPPLWLPPMTRPSPASAF